ncbi:hypothetical protein RJ639_022356 [Escallonia herrerae]|uniref:Replication protein A OB domain-containing protein n=1 Tax=Escallonia herrerae TaxID=1293975 RepID=A0AA88V2Q1_9ASTE|nr:hypothetical protein RJ639_022356 [Escallonia herrerae]
MAFVATLMASSSSSSSSSSLSESIFLAPPSMVCAAIKKLSAAIKKLRQFYFMMKTGKKDENLSKSDCLKEGKKEPKFVKEKLGNSAKQDVIGILSKVFDVEDFGIKPGRTRPLFKKDITLTNKRGQELKVTLWSEQALEFENILKNQTTTEIHLDLMLMPGKKNIGNIHLSSTSATEIYANLNIKEANDLRERIHNAIDQNFEIKMLPPPTKPTIEEIKLTNRLTIDQILNMKFEDGQRVSKNPDANDDTQKVQNSDTTTKRKRIKNNSEAGDNATQPNDDTSQLEDTEDEECEHVPIVKQQAKVPERRESRRARKKKIIMDD